MYKIFSVNRGLVVDAADGRCVGETVTDCEEAVCKLTGQLPCAAGTLTLLSEAPEAAFQDICSRFQEEEAAGGVVRDPAGSVLLILRLGHWDFPKGHLEAGETLSECALREVEEETGIRAALARPQPLCVTHHVYVRDGQWFLKHTTWYAMTVDVAHSPVPQREEGIDRAEWIPSAQIQRCRARTYPSLQEVFNFV